MVLLYIYDLVQSVMVCPTFLCSVFYNEGSLSLLCGPGECELATSKNVAVPCRLCHGTGSIAIQCMVCHDSVAVQCIVGPGSIAVKCLVSHKNIAVKSYRTSPLNSNLQISTFIS